MNTQASNNEQRLQKVLAAAGIASRRASETLITSGRVTVDGEVVTELGRRVDIEKNEVRVDGVVVQLDVEKRYFVLNKPEGVVSSLADEKGRPDLKKFSNRGNLRLINVGRLDRDTSGLLIMTNDGELANRLAHPKYEVPKTYVARVKGRMTPAKIKLLREGFELEDGHIHADYAKLLPGSNKDFSLVEVTLHSGRNRIVRRMLAHTGHPVVDLVRRSFGPLHLGTLGIGKMRELSEPEIDALLTAGADGGKKSKRVTAGRPGDGAGARGRHGIARAKRRKNS